jgi:integrase/recombinase XerD
MSALGRHVEEYLALRRALGFKLERTGRLLADFVGFAERAGVATVTIEVAAGWAGLPANASPVWIAQRLGVVRVFARYLAAIDPDAEIPPADLLPGRARRITPYLYSDADIAALMAAARMLANPLKAATFETLIGLLAATGLRGGEAMRLDRQDLDWGQGLLIVRDTKFGKSRQVHLHDTSLEALRGYGVRRDRLCPWPPTASLFVSTSGARLCHATVQPAFRRLLVQAGVGPRAGSGRPRIHDLRHSFAVRTLLRWYQNGEDVQARMPALSTHLGHVDPGATYWYLSAAPELLALAAQRLEATFGTSS